jgi:hypothetical protein
VRRRRRPRTGYGSSRRVGLVRDPHLRSRDLHRAQRDPRRERSGYERAGLSGVRRVLAFQGCRSFDHPIRSGIWHLPLSLQDRLLTHETRPCFVRLDLTPAASSPPRLTLPEIPADRRFPTVVVQPQARLRPRHNPTSSVCPTTRPLPSHQPCGGRVVGQTESLQSSAAAGAEAGLATAIVAVVPAVVLAVAHASVGYHNGRAGARASLSASSPIGWGVDRPPSRAGSVTTGIRHWGRRNRRSEPAALISR